LYLLKDSNSNFTKKLERDNILSFNFDFQILPIVNVAFFWHANFLSRSARGPQKTLHGFLSSPAVKQIDKKKTKR
jgi:hypothetical protein